MRLIAGSLGGVRGPGDTKTPITYAHATLAPGARLRTAWRPEFNALVYVVSGRGSIGTERRPIHEGQIAVLGSGEAVEVRADATQDAPSAGGMDVLLLGGLPIREQIAWYGPFVMNTRDELIQAVEDYRTGRMGEIPPELSRT
ncbi:MAG: pirin family protein [Actinomycetota bacterium]